MGLLVAQVQPLPPDSRIAVDYKPKSAPATAATHARWFLSFLALTLIGGITLYRITSTQQEVADAVLQVPALAPGDLPLQRTDDFLATPMPKPLGETVEFIVRRNDTLDRIFRQLKLSLADLADIRDVRSAREQLDQLRPGDVITVVHEDGAVHSLQRRVSETQILNVT